MMGMGAFPLAEMGGEAGRAPPGVPGGPCRVVGDPISRPPSSPPPTIHPYPPLRESHGGEGRSDLIY
jgi:hypothetical protein